ncbi:MAG TPA: hypothetical protein PLF61_07400 [Candidatus Goldiibacteriota bacterium]|nr:hypothetical protein [Candidatus Goldiibacteriota bacterium]
MKKVIFLIVILMMIIVNCGKIKSLPSYVLELSPGGQDDSDFPFETSTHNFSNTTISDNMAFFSIGLSKDRFYKGESCLKVNCNFSGQTNYRGGAITQSNTTIEMAGKTLKAYVWVPSGMFDGNNPYGATFFILTAGNYHWYQSDWQNLTLPPESVAGVWNEIKFEVDKMKYNDNGTSKTYIEMGDDINKQWQWGLKIGMGDNSTTFNAIIYIDSISIE